MPSPSDRLTQPGRGRRRGPRLPAFRMAFWVRLGLALLVGLSLAACSQIATLPPTFAIPTTALPASTSSATPTPAPTLQPSSTETPPPPTLTTAEVSQTLSADTLQAFILTQMQTLEMPSPSATPCPLSGCASPTPTRTPPLSPTPSLTATPTFPAAYIQIHYPGPLSKVVSPLHLEASTHTGPNGTIDVELLGEDGGILYRQIFRSTIDDVSYYNLNLNIDYEIPGVAEAARLQVSVLDAAKRLVAEASYNLVLLNMGDEDINPPDDGVASIVIHQPSVYADIKGGILHVEGLVRPPNNSALTAQLYTDDGKLVGARQFTTQELPLGVYRPFALDIPYTVTQQRSVRLTIYQEGDPIPGAILAESVLIFLEP